MGFLSEGRHTGLTVSLGDPSGPHPEKTGELVGLRQCWAESGTSLNETPMWRTSADTVRLASPNTRSHTPGYGRQYCKQSPNQPCHRPMRDPSPGGTASVSVVTLPLVAFPQHLCTSQRGPSFPYLICGRPENYPCWAKYWRGQAECSLT